MNFELFTRQRIERPPFDFPFDFVLDFRFACMKIYVLFPFVYFFFYLFGSIFTRDKCTRMIKTSELSEPANNKARAWVSRNRVFSTHLWPPRRVLHFPYFVTSPIFAPIFRSRFPFVKICRWTVFICFLPSKSLFKGCSIPTTKPGLPGILSLSYEPTIVDRLFYQSGSEIFIFQAFIKLRQRCGQRWHASRCCRFDF